MKTAEGTEVKNCETMTQAAGERAKDYVDVGVNALNAATGKARQLSRTADSYVRENPWLVVGAAAGVGILIGFLLRGRRST